MSAAAFFSTPYICGGRHIELLYVNNSPKIYLLLIADIFHICLSDTYVQRYINHYIEIFQTWFGICIVNTHD